MIWSIEISLKMGFINTHWATENKFFPQIDSPFVTVPSKHLAFLSFHICQITARKVSFHISFPLCDPMGDFQAMNKSRIWFGRTQLQPNQLRTVFQIFTAILHCRRRWSNVSSSFKHIGNAFTSILPLCLRLSRVRIHFQRTNQPKTTILDGDLNFQALFIWGLLSDVVDFSD